ncbi:hypothetical protein MFLAVUS_010743 [Mucor flavus]|uniref:C2H2-type domain-containing protein n=1 Tax=Mucor flavus TaxID=439312 RepID=A0ABP9ZDK4_9FUNG
MFFDTPDSRPGMKPKVIEVDIFRDDIGKELIALDHGCYICGRIYCTAGTVRKHIRNVHGYDIPARPNNLNRPMEINYYYKLRKNTDYYDVIHYACPSCWFHCPLDDLALFTDHTLVEHKPKPIVSERNDKNDIDVGINSRICCD